MRYVPLVLLVFLGAIVSGCEDGGVVPKVSEGVQGEVMWTGTVTSSWSQSVAVSSTTVVVCVNGECEVYHDGEVCQMEGRL